MHTETTWALWSDDQLVRAVAAGQTGAYAVLRERHTPGLHAVADRLCATPEAAARAVDDVFARVLGALASGRPLGMPLRTYLLGGVAPLSTAGPSGPDADPAAQTVVAAYRSLPERSQALLWYTEVEGLSPLAVAPVLGVTPGGAAALADRARAGLRQAYVPPAVPPLGPDCVGVRSSLRSYVRGTLGPRDVELVDDHLAACAACRTQVLAPADVTHAMRVHVAPTVVGAVPGVAAALAGVGFGGSAGLLALGEPEPAAPVDDTARDGDDPAAAVTAAPEGAPRPDRAPVLLPVALGASAVRAEASPAPERDVPAGMLAVGGMGALVAAAVGVIAALGATLGVVDVDTSNAATLPVTADGGSALSSRAAFPAVGEAVPPPTFAPEVFPSVVPPLEPVLIGPALAIPLVTPEPAAPAAGRSTQPTAPAPQPARRQSAVPAPVPTVRATPAPVPAAPVPPAPEPPAPVPAPEPPAPPAPQPPAPEPPAPQPPAPEPPAPQPPAPPAPQPPAPEPELPDPGPPVPAEPVVPEEPEPPVVVPDTGDDDGPQAGNGNGRGRDRDEGPRRGRGDRDRDNDRGRDRDRDRD